MAGYMGRALLLATATSHTVVFGHLLLLVIFFSCAMGRTTNPLVCSMAVACGP